MPLFGKSRDGVREGYEPAAAALVAESLGRPLEWVFTPWVEMVDALNAGHGDAIWCGQGITAERRRRVDFTRPYAVFDESLLVRAGSGLSSPGRARRAPDRRDRRQHEHGARRDVRGRRAHPVRRAERRRVRRDDRRAPRGRGRRHRGRRRGARAARGRPGLRGRLHGPDPQRVGGCRGEGPAGAARRARPRARRCDRRRPPRKLLASAGCRSSTYPFGAR